MKKKIIITAIVIVVITISWVAYASYAWNSLITKF